MFSVPAPLHVTSRTVPETTGNVVVVWTFCQAGFNPVHSARVLHVLNGCKDFLSYLIFNPRFNGFLHLNKQHTLRFIMGMKFLAESC